MDLPTIVTVSSAVIFMESSYLEEHLKSIFCTVSILDAMMDCECA
jgi:hypothetical protein